MGTIVVVLLLALVLAAAVIVYAAYPYRGEDTPLSPQLGRARRGGVAVLPTLDAHQQGLGGTQAVSVIAGARTEVVTHR